MERLPSYHDSGEDDGLENPKTNQTCRNTTDIEAVPISELLIHG